VNLGVFVAKILGIDQGTTQTTAVVVSDTGQPLARHSVALPARFPSPGWVEQEPGDILRSVTQACAPLLAEHEIDAVGLDNQGETFLFWDRQTGEPATPAIVWQDTRAAALCKAMSDHVDAKWIRSKTGLMLDSYFSAPKIRWLFEHQPELRRRAHAGELLFGTTDTWVLWSLSGGKLHVTDASTASRTLLFDIHRCAWDDELLALFDVPRCVLPEVRSSAGLVGQVRLGLDAEIPVHAMLVDQQAALVGQGCLTAGDMKCSFGTGSFLLMNLGQTPRLSNHGLLTTIGWQAQGKTHYALDGGIFVTGSAVQWLGDNLGLIPHAAASEAAARRSTDHNVVVVPSLQGLAAPHWRTDVRGAMFGLSRASRGDDIVRATLDGIACRTREVVDAMSHDAGVRPAHLKVDGGPSGNAYLMQRIADLAAVEVHVTREVEAAAIGVADLAASSALGSSLQKLASSRQPAIVYRPDMGESERARITTQWNRALKAVKHFHSDAESDGPA
jgi:glycerol kinase